jgi:exoribonuclease-2
LGLDEYTQVTSPLRRYTDLLAHQQIRAFLTGEEPLEEEDLAARLAAAEAAASAAAKAERASRAHWITVYLADLKARGDDRAWEGVVMEKKGSRGVVLIPALGLETQAALREDAQPNDAVSLSLGSVKIHEALAVFMVKS